MFKGRVEKLILVLSFFWSLVVNAQDQNSVYLSYEQKVIAQYALAAYGESPEKQKEIVSLRSSPKT